MIALGIDDAAVFKGEGHILKGGAPIAGGDIVANYAVGAVFNWGGVDFTVGNVAFAGSFNGVNALN